MINQQLVEYIKQQVQAGVPKDAVRKALGDAGWPPADVDDSMKAAEPAASAMPASAASASQAMINPVVAMGGADTPAKASATAGTAASSSEKFFSKPATASVVTEEDKRPASKSSLIVMIAMGAVILLLAGALAFVYFNLNGQLDAAQSGNPADSAQLSSLQQQVTQLTSDKNGLTTQMQTLSADNQMLIDELSFVAASGTSTAPVPATVKGTLSGNASSTFVLMTQHNVKVFVANSKDAKVSSALTPLVNGTSSVILAGNHAAGSPNLTVTSVNGAAL